MPNYEYVCESCNRSFERFARFADYSPKLECECGAVATSIISGGKYAMVKGMGEYKFDPRYNAPTYRGRRADREERHYEKIVETQRSIVKERRKSGKEKKDGWVFEGCMPAPMATSIGQKEGDIEAVFKDPIPFLKATGTYMGDE